MMMMYQRRQRRQLLLFLVVLLSTTTRISSVDTPETSIDDQDCLSIQDIVCTVGGFDILCTLLDTMVVDFTLSDEWTMFLPTDQAFNEIGIATETINEMKDETIVDLVQFHLVDTIINSTELNCTQTLTMYNGEASRTVCSSSTNGNNNKKYQKGVGNTRESLDDFTKLPEIIVSNLYACNGLIHVINRVMLPYALDVKEQRLKRQMSPTTTPTTPTTPSSPPLNNSCSDPSATTVLDFICNSKVTSTYCEMLAEYNLMDVLYYYEREEGNNRNWTIFVPYNPAFTNTNKENWDYDATRDILMFHTIQDRVVFTKDMVCGDLLTNVEWTRF